MSRHGKKSRARAQKNPVRPRTKRRRKVSLRAQPRRDTGRAVATARELSPLARLIHTRLAEKLRFQIVGMTGAILQGVRATRLDTDLWVDLPPRQSMRITNLCLKHDAKMRANTVVDLSDGSTVN